MKNVFFGLLNKTSPKMVSPFSVLGAILLLFKFSIYFFCKFGIILSFFIVYSVFFIVLTWLNRFVLAKMVSSFNRKENDSEEKIFTRNLLNKEGLLVLQVINFQSELKKYYFSQNNLTYSEMLFVIELYFKLENFLHYRRCDFNLTALCNDVCSFQKIMHKNFKHSLSKQIDMLLLVCSQKNQCNVLIN